jgi:hypothetical protein
MPSHSPSQAVCLLSELKQTQRSVVKCLSEAEQAKKDYDELKQKTQKIMMQLQQVGGPRDVSVTNIDQPKVLNHFSFLVSFFKKLPGNLYNGKIAFLFYSLFYGVHCLLFNVCQYFT